MNKSYFIIIATTTLVIVVGFFLYLSTENKIPTIYPPDGPVRELPANVPELVRPSSIPCIYSLWKNSNESCGSSENIFEAKKLNNKYFSLLFGTFSSEGDAKIHLKKLKKLKFLSSYIVKIDEIPATNKSIIIERGDTLSRIAERHSLKVKKITDDNNITNPNNIRIGQNLIIPGDSLKYRIISTNIKLKKTAEDLCDKLLNLNFRCQTQIQR